MKFRYFISLFLFGLIITSISAIGQVPRKIMEVKRVTKKVKLDGILNEEEWFNGMYADSFIQKEPTPGQPESFNTKVYGMYDNQAIYFAFVNHDPEPNKILRELSYRDELGNSDNVSVILDPYQSGVNGFSFTVTSSGVQLDAVVSNDDISYTWNAVWKSAVAINDQGWVCEIEIPFSAIRFSKEKTQSWNIQFAREIRRFRETSYWNPEDPLIDGQLVQMGKIVGLDEIVAPIRLALTPYVSQYYNRNVDGKHSFQTRGGMDLKYGINKAFTLDMSLIPDFGQVAYDQLVVNLSAIEQFYVEQRQFFTEGTELFDKSGIFYSRRIGDFSPDAQNIFQKNLKGRQYSNFSGIPQLINATKITGRTKNGAGLGFFNAITGKSTYDLTDSLGNIEKIIYSPLTNYNVLVYDQNLPNNSYVNVINSNVWRQGVFRKANVSGVNFDLRDKHQLISVKGAFNYSNLSQSADHEGIQYSVGIEKLKGSWQLGLENYGISRYYNISDLGYNPYINLMNNKSFIRYRSFSPKKEKIQRFDLGLTNEIQTLFQSGKFTSASLALDFFQLYKSRDAFGFDVVFNPFGQHDYYEPRRFDFISYLAIPASINVNGFISSDYRKKFALDLSLGTERFNQNDRSEFYTQISPRFRFNNKFSIRGSFEYSNSKNEFGNVGYFLNTASWPVSIERNAILIGNRQRKTFDNSLSVLYLFNKNMGLNAQLRHYWTNYFYDSYGILKHDGAVDIRENIWTEPTKVPNLDENVNFFTIDFGFTWRFAPGSDIIFNWKNGLFSSSDFGTRYFDNLNQLWSEPSDNSLSVKILYYFDYNYLRKK